MSLVARFRLMAVYGFRPFFLLAGVSALLDMVLWLMMLTLPGTIDLLPAGPEPLHLWHAHEMIFGYAGAALAGFLLTAVPNWTGAQRLQGKPLVALVLAYLAGRIAMLPLGLVPPMAALVLDNLFLPGLSLAVFAHLRQRPTLRNGALLALVPLLALANLWWHGARVGLLPGGLADALQAGLIVIAMMLAVMGGRLVPNFSRNALMSRGITKLPVSHPKLDLTALVLSAALIPLVVLPVPGLILAGFAALAALAHAIRFSGWASWQTRGQPIVWVLHVGYGWLVTGLALLALGAAGLVPPQAWIHALGAGATGIMTLAVMTRAALGHTGHALVVAPAIAWAYHLVSVSALARIAAAVFPQAYMPLVLLAGGAWIAGFALYLWVYAPLLTRPRADGRPG